MIKNAIRFLTQARRTLILLLMGLNLPVLAQYTTVSDIVMDKSGDGIPRAIVLVKGTATDVNGYYRLSTAPDTILVVRYFKDFHSLRPIPQCQINLVTRDPLCPEAGPLKKRGFSIQV